MLRDWQNLDKEGRLPKALRSAKVGVLAGTARSGHMHTYMDSNFAEEDEEEEKKTEEREWSTCTCTPSPCSLLAHASTRTSRSTCKEATALNACILIGPFLKKSEMLLRSSGVAGTAVQSSRVCGPVLCAPVPMLDISGCLVGSAKPR